MIREVVARLGQDQWGRAHGVLKPRHCSWNGKAPQMTGNERLDGRWLVAGAAPMRDEAERKEPPADEEAEPEKGERVALHVISLAMGPALQSE